jgi:hypothetical protein
MDESNIAKLKAELEKLVKKGALLRIALAVELEKVGPEDMKSLKEVKLPSFKDEYEAWYSLAMQIVKQLIPDRLPDFVKLYKDEKRKEISYLTYGVADCLIGLQSTYAGRTVADSNAAFPKFEQQLNILKAAQIRFDSALFDIIEVAQADLFDNELEAAKELTDKGFGRGAGAVAGVVLERHLGRIAAKRNLKQRKSTPTINDLNQLLKDNDVIDTASWRFIQHLGDLRNLCDHDKGREPTKDQITDLIAGVSKIIKTIL